MRETDLEAPGPRYESVYLTAWEPSGGRAVWIRNTLLRRAHGPAVRSAWLTVFAADRAPVAVKQRTEACVIDLMRATGRVDGAQWSLAIEPQAPGFDYLPRPWMYDAPLPRTKAELACPVARCSGEVTVRGEPLQLDRWPAVIAHNWGGEHPRRASWIHAAGFDGQPEAYVDLVAARLAVGPLVTPWIANGTLRLDGETHRLGGLRPGAAALAARPTAARFVLRGRGIVVHGRVAAPASRFVGWRYTDPRTWRWHPTLNCSVADLELSVARRGRPEVTLRCSGRAAYEIQLAERGHGIGLQPHSDP